MFRELILEKLPRSLAERYLDHIVHKEGQMESLVLRKYYLKHYKVDVDLYSYGGCFKKDFNNGGTVKVGKYCSFANNIHYFAANHPMSYPTSSAYFYNKALGFDVKDVERHHLEIGHDVWVGYGTIITSGCRSIGNGSVIGAGSVVTHDVPAYSIVAGNPAKVLRMRFTEKEISELENSRWWELQPDVLYREMYSYFNNISEFAKHCHFYEEKK